MQWSNLLKMAGLIVAYLTLSKFNASFAATTDHIAILNLANGLALPVLLLGGWRYVWLLLLAGILVYGLQGETVEVAIMKAVATSLTCLGVSRCLLHIDSEMHLLSTAASYLKFIALAAFLGGAVDALALTAISIAFELSLTTDYWLLFCRVWMANILGVTLLSPLLLSINATAMRSFKLRGSAKSLLLFLAAFLPGQIGIFGAANIGLLLPPDISWLFIALIGCAAYAEVYLAALLILIFAVESLFVAQLGVGLFAQDWQDNQLVRYGFSMLLLSLSVMLLVQHLRNMHSELVELRGKETFYRLITENIEDFIAVLDVHGRRVYNTPSYARLFGSVDNLKGTDCFKEIHPDDREHIKEVFNETLRSGKGQWTEFRFVLSDNSIRTMESRGGVMQGKNKQEAWVVVVSRDITERKQNEMNQRIAAIAFESQEGMFVADAERNILRVNQAFTEITGYSADDVKGKSMNILRSDRHDAAFFRVIDERIASAGLWRGELWSRRKNGQTYPEQHTLNAVINEKGEVTHYVAMLADITERKLTEDKIKQFAFSDPLTQLANRRQLLDRLEHCIELGKRDRKKLALLMLDLDRFKEVNDDMGHDAGDELLKQVAERLTARLRSVDLIARWGGDEFIVLLENIQKREDVAKVAEDIIMDMHKAFKIGHRDDVRVGVSIGISLYPEHGNTPETLREQADIALYKAKDNGRGCYAYFSEDLTLVAVSKQDG